MFAKRGEIVTLVGEHSREGVTVVARDSGPDIPNLGQALQDGYSYRRHGAGPAGLAPAHGRVEISTEVDKGTTVTMTKWRRDT